MAKKYNRSWHADRQMKKGGSNIRGNKKEPWERSKVSGHTRTINGKKVHVDAYYRHKGKK